MDNLTKRIETKKMYCKKSKNHYNLDMIKLLQFS